MTVSPALPRLYLSGPMTGLPLLNRPAFHAAARQLREAGFDVFNPAEMDEPDGISWVQCLRRDIRELMDCEAVATLPGWKRSRGAQLEAYIAVALCMPVHPVPHWLTVAAAGPELRVLA